MLSKDTALLFQVGGIVLCLALVIFVQIRTIRIQNGWNAAIEKLAAALGGSRQQGSLLNSMILPIYSGQYQGTGFKMVSLPQGRTASFLMLSVETSFPKFRLVKPVSKEVLLRFSTKIVTGDCYFDREFLIFSNEVMLRTPEFWNTSTKNLIKQVMLLGCSSLESNGKELLLRWSPFDITCAEHPDTFARAIGFAQHLSGIKVPLSSAFQL